MSLGERQPECKLIPLEAHPGLKDHILMSVTCTDIFILWKFLIYKIEKTVAGFAWADPPPQLAVKLLMQRSSSQHLKTTLADCNCCCHTPRSLHTHHHCRNHLHSLGRAFHYYCRSLNCTLDPWHFCDRSSNSHHKVGYQGICHYLDIVRLHPQQYL